MSRHEYLPCGWELYSGLTGRTTGHGYLTLTSPEGVPTPTQRFTGKERDTVETGLDYFGARYYSAGQGRFTSVDPKGFHVGTIANPQKWNKYAYTLNNPLAFVDPDGREEIKLTVTGFIPDRSFRFPPVVGPTFRGDGRSFDPDSDRFRIRGTVTIETDPRIRANPVVSFGNLGTGSCENIRLNNHSNLDRV